MIVAVLLMAALSWAWLPSPGPATPAREQAATAGGFAAALGTLGVPGGVAPLAEAAGLDPAMPRARVMLALIRSLYELPDGVDPEADGRRARVRAYLDTLQPGGPPASDLVPLPLSAAAWNTIAGSGRDSPLVTRILGSRDPALLYYGLSAMDRPTAEWLESQSGVLPLLMTGRRPALMAAFGRSVVVRDGHVVVPGGPDAEPLWAALVGARPDAASEFILRVLDADRGGLALFYDSVAHLDSGQQAFALDSHNRDSGLRLERFSLLYREMRKALAGFDPGARPFDRVADDFAHLLLFTQTSPDGFLGSPQSLELWRAALTRSGIPGDPKRELAGRNLTVPLDAAGLAALVSTPDASIRRERTETWFFGQRVFNLAAESEYPDVLVALRALGQYKALLLTLERMGIRQPGVFVLAVRHAQKIGETGDGRRARIELGLFQGALGIIERARFSRALDVSTAESLVRALCSAGQSPSAGARETWVERVLLPALDRDVRPGAGARPDRPLEDLVLAAMSGLAGDRAPGPGLEWEGLRYRVDPAAGEFRRLLAIRARQGGVSLDAALALSRAAASVSGATSAASLASARDRLVEVTAMFAAVPAYGGPGAGQGEPSVGAALEEATRQLDRLRSPRPADLAQIARPLAQAADAQLAAALLSLAYTPHLGYPDSPVLLGGDPSVQHDFGLDQPRPAVRERLPWQVPVEIRSRDAGWRLTGSALGLDVALARLSLRRAISETFPPPPAYRETERAAFAEGAVLTDPFDADDDARGRLVAAVRAGRERLLGSARDPGRLAALALDAGLDEWRANMLPWMGAHEPERASEIVSLGEMAVLGGAREFAPGTLAASGWSLGAQLGGVPLAWRGWTTLAGRKSTSLVPALVPDLAVGIAEALDRLGVPQALGRGVLLMATQDLLDSLRTNHDDDWMTLVGRAQRVASGPVEDYVAGQTIWGGLIPDGRGTH